MSKKAKIIIAIVVVILIALIIYFVMKKKSDNKEVSTTTKTTSGLASLDLGGIFGGLLGGGKDSNQAAGQNYADVAGTDGWALMDF